MLVDALSEIGFHTVGIAIFGGALFGWVYSLFVPHGTARRMLTMGFLAWLFSFALQAISPLLTLARGGEHHTSLDSHLLWHGIEPSLVWWAFILSSIGAISIIEWKRRKDDCLS